MMKRVFGLRYEVYCVERQFLPIHNYPDGLEFDEFDAQSAHFCETSDDDELIGYVRLVRAESNGDFPFMAHCRGIYADAVLPRAEESAEISRLIVHPSLRRRRTDQDAGPMFADIEPPSLDERRRSSHEVLPPLYRQMYVYSVRVGIRYWYAAMERVLARSLRQLNFPFNQIGDQTDYYGPVAPYVIDLRELESRLSERNPAFLGWLQEGLDLHELTGEPVSERFGHHGGHSVVPQVPVSQRRTPFHPVAAPASRAIALA